MTSLSDALFNKTKQKVLGIMFVQPDRELHMREIARMSKVTVSSIQRELELLTKAGILLSSKQGNQTIFKANKQCPIYDELLGFARKTFGISGLIKQALADVEGIKVAFIYGSVAKGEEKSLSDVDVLLIGDVNYSDAMNSILGVEGKIGRPINAKVFREDEVKTKLAENSSFLTEVLKNKKLFLMGNQNDLEKLEL